MIVRTYKRRSRGDLFGSQGSAGDGDDDELGLRSSLSQEDDSELAFWSSWQPSSQGSSSVEDGNSLRSASLPTHRPQLLQEPDKSLRHANTIAADGRRNSAGQKLIRAESMLKKPKKSSNLSFKAREGTANGDGLVRARAVNCATQSGHPRVGITEFDAEDCEATARAARVRDEGESKAISFSAQILTVGPCAPPTSTLLEAQESGEMMEYVDEANFAMDGLRPGQPLRICRASLISLLSIFGTRQHRRLLRTHGMVKPVLDAVLTVPTEDSATALAAAALLYVIAYDGQDEVFLDSPACIQFLMKLLEPIPRTAQDKRLSHLGSRLLALSSNSKENKVETEAPVLDQGSLLLVQKVNDILCSMKGRSDGVPNLDNQSASFQAEELSSEWLVLLTLEKACLSTVVLEDNAGSVRRVGGYFKERLRELGGLNTVCELAASCFINLRKIQSKMDCQHQSTLLKGSRGVGVLLRCLRVMENVTFLSDKNQKFLLEMILSKSGVESPRTFLEVVIGSINIVSGFILSRNQTQKKSKGAESKKGSESSGRGGKDTGLTSGGSKAKGSFDFEDIDGNEMDSACNQAVKKQKGQTSKSRETCKAGSAKSIPSRNDIDVPSEESHDDLLENCLLSAVKVLMNLTNDNDLGCRQVAVVRGLDAMASLIVRHFPSFHCFPSDAQAKNGGRKASEKSFREKPAEHQDQDLDLLVVVLGVLVNLVEKDTKNRGRLIALNTEDFYDISDGAVAGKHSIIKLLCSIFLSKKGSGKAVESNKNDCASEIDAKESFEQGQQEAENMILEAYSALLLAFLSKESPTVRKAIAQHLPEGDLSVLVPVLERFLDFHLSLNMLSSDTHQTVKEVIESCK